MPKHLADYGSAPVDFVRGNGSYVYDKNGKKFLDFQTGWCVGTVGWKNKEMAEAISAQAREGFHEPPWFRVERHETFASRLVKLAPGKLNRVFRACSGSEAVEFAIKAARAATKKQTVVTIEGVYHGHTYGAGSVGNAFGGVLEPCDGFAKVPMPKNQKQEIETLREIEALFAQGDVAAFLSEPVWTNAGCFIPSPAFYPAVQTLCRNYGVLLAMDEVATCMGRCGKMFGSELWGIEPDIVTLGKSFTGGYATMAATLVTESVFKNARGIPSHPTFGWMFQDLAAVEKNVEIIIRDRLDENAAGVGAYLLDLLKPLESLKKVKEVRGIGMVLAIEFHLPVAVLVAAKCYRAGLVVEFTDSKTLFLSPMLNLKKSDARKGAEIIRAACGLK
ncbi:MAG: aspartate aminotransferase family protein [Candidatus Uhrbacteria bacterium]